MVYGAMVAKLCSRSHGHPEPGVRNAAMMSISAPISREGFIAAPGALAVLQSTDSHKTYYGTFRMGFGKMGVSQVPTILIEPAQPPYAGASASSIVSPSNAGSTCGGSSPRSLS